MLHYLVQNFLPIKYFWWPSCFSERESTFHYLNVREKWTEKEPREVLVGLCPTVDSAEATGKILPPHLHRDPRSPLLPDPNQESLLQREAVLCRIEVAPTPLTIHRAVQAQVLVLRVRTRLPLLVERQPPQPLLLLPPLHPAPLPLMDMLFLIPTRSQSLCLTLAGLWMEVRTEALIGSQSLV